VKPKNGNIPTVNARNISLRSRKFYEDISVFQRIYSSTGELINTKQFTEGILPLKNTFFQITFAEEVELSAKYFAVVSSE